MPTEPLRKVPRPAVVHRPPVSGTARVSGLLGLLVTGQVGDLRGTFLWGADLAFWRLVAMGCDGLERVSCGLCADWADSSVWPHAIPTSMIPDDRGAGAHVVQQPRGMV
jgi:hypothetical protein